MSCQHSNTTAVMAAFGEAPPEFEEHLSGCADCLATVQEHTATLAILEPAIQALPPTAPDQSPNWKTPIIGFLVAAAILLAIQFPSATPVDPVRQQTTASASVTTTADPFHDSLDDDLASLELALDLYYLEES